MNVGRQGSAVWADGWDDAPRPSSSEEAAVGVARRLQARLDRHLWLLERLRAEQSYPEPPGFAELAESGHRMRRDTESLLVLGGQEPGVRGGAPRKLSDILAEAAGAAEEPGRVDVRTAPAATVAPAAAAEFLHVLSELVDDVTSVYRGARLDVASRVEGRGIVVDVSVDGGARLALDDMSGDGVAVIAEQIAGRSRHGVSLSRPLAGPPRSGPGPVASVHCPPAAVTLEEPRPVLSEPLLPTRNGNGLGNDPLGLGSDPLGTRSDRLGPADDPLGLGNDRLGSGSDRLGLSNDPLGLSNDRLGSGSDRLGLSNDPLDSGSDRLGLRNDRLGSGSDRLGLGSDPLGLSDDARRLRDDPLGLGNDPLGLSDESVRGSDDALGSGDDNPFAPRNGSSEYGSSPFESPQFESSPFASSSYGSYEPGNGLGLVANGSVFSSNGPEQTGSAAAYPGSSTDEPAAPEYALPSRSSSPPVDELFGPLLDLPQEPMDDRFSTPIFEAIASAWFRDPEPEQAADGSDGAVNGSGPVDWESPSDREWREAAARATRPDTASGTTSSGLPRRRPGDQLVPPPRPQDPNPVTERVPDRVRERLATYQRGLRQGRHRAPGAAEPDAW
ncbi:hypothetical protein [Pseudonocardia alaniniphila]|uniref:Uncharacterized protein n=1 Tax=Pseudonocardia alaniniphila TaxID=75291 RepID=A0ABS9TAN1_9PSEU|nr:hypothetical protein [Pseudonocardia alaniniphila]MCH6165488.1 hypothetical protein [Pseudonocardia alaniniphila]